MPGMRRAFLSARRFEDFACDLAGGERVDGDGEVRGAIEGKAAFVAGGEIGLVGEYGASTLRATASGERGGELDLKMDKKCARGVEEEISGLGALNRTAAECKHKGISGCYADDGRVLAVAKGRFAVTGEELGDGAAGFSFDNVVDVDESPAEALCDEGADGGFAGAHETGEYDATWRGQCQWIRMGVLRQGNLSASSGIAGPV
jgi:hypothetical protein